MANFLLEMIEVGNGYNGGEFFFWRCLRLVMYILVANFLLDMFEVVHMYAGGNFSSGYA